MSNCNSCTSNGSCNKEQSNCTVENNPLNKIKKIIGVMSGKGGVGKSTVSALIAKNLRKRGYKVGVLDADIIGPSIPRLLGVDKQRARASEEFIYPAVTADGIKVMSLNLLIEKEDEPVIWRGAMVSNAVKQFYTDVFWGKLDVLLIDMPPGTGDVALTTFQSIPLDGIVMVTTPQDLVSMIVSKACKMANMMNVKIMGVVENMAYVECPNCHEKIYLYGKSKTIDLIKPYNLDLLASLPINPQLTELVNEGRIEEYEGNYLDSVADKIISNIDIGDAD